MRTPAALLFAVLSLLLLFGGCNDDGESTAAQGSSGAPRAFAMGLGSLPAELTNDSYAQAFQRAGSAGELVLVQRVPPWDELLAPDAFPSDDTVQTTQRETQLSRDNDLDLFFAIDPTDASTGRSQLADLPDDLRGAGFSNERIRDAFIQYAQYVALNYEPKYLALGIEINSYQPRRPEDFEQFVSLYAEAYDAVKELSPDTLVFPTFQLEEMKGLLPLDLPRPPQWGLIQRFEPRLDLLAVSTFPSLVAIHPAALAEDYYDEIRSHSDRPIAIAEMGYSSGANSGPDPGTEEEQARYLRRVLDDAGRLSMPFIVWFVGQDPAYTGQVALHVLEETGLLRRDGSSKEAWGVWTEAAERPLAAN